MLHEVADRWSHRMSNCHARTSGGFYLLETVTVCCREKRDEIRLQCCKINCNREIKYTKAVCDRFCSAGQISFGKHSFCKKGF